MNSSLFVTMLVIGASGCTIQTSIRKTDKTAPNGANALSWLQATPQKVTGVTATWVVSSSSDLFNQKIQYYSDASCGTTSGGLIDLGSATIATNAFTGVDGVTYSYKITSLDAKGNASVSACSTPMMIDTTAPSLAITAAPVWINNANKTAYVVSGTCSDATSGIPGNVTVTVTDGTGVNTAPSLCVAGVFSATVNTTTHAMLDGNNNISITATVFDAATNSTTTAATIVSKDTTNPTITITSAPTWINVANKAAYVVAGACSDATSGISGNVTVTLTDGTNSVSKTGACAAGAYSISLDTTTSTPGLMAEGSNNISITAQVSDAATNTGTSAVTTRSKDTVNPTLTLTSASIPTWVNIANKAAYPIIGTCSDATSTISGNVSILISDGVNSKTVTATCAAYTAGITVNMTTGFAPGASLVDGVNNISITASVSDVATNSTTTATLTRSKDTVAPTVTSITSTTADGTYTSGTINFTITYSEAVTVTGASFTLNTVSSTGTATCTNITNATTQSCSYTVTLGQGSPDLDYLATTSLSVATFFDIAANNGVTTLAAPGAAGSIAIGSALDINPPNLQWEVVAGTGVTTFSYGTAVSTDILQTFILHNYQRGQTTTAIGNATLSGTNAAAYAVTTDNCTGNTLTYNSSCTVIVKFKGGTQLEGPFAATLTSTAAIGGSAAINLSGTVVCPSTQLSYAAATTTSYTVPGGCTKISAKLWGAAGASAYYSAGGVGGAGAYVGGTKIVAPGTVIDINVGGGGIAPFTGGANGGGNGWMGGGGYSALSISSSYFLIAGGGGASSMDYAGGAGGIATGVAGSTGSAGHGGGGGTQAAGGAGGNSATNPCTAVGQVGTTAGMPGASLQGGLGTACSAMTGGGGGGGGYYGGGAGSGYTDVSAQQGAGGGGSSYISSSVFATSSFAGAGMVPGNSTDTDRGTAGEATAAFMTSGNPGKVLINVSASHAYIADMTDVYKCSVSDSNGSLSACTVSNGGATFVGLNGITVASIGSNTYAYVADNGSGSIKLCSVAAVGGALSGCAATPSAGAPAWSPQGITTRNIGGTNYAFITDAAGPSIYTCTISAANGTLSACTAGTSGGENPGGIAFDNASGTNYVYASGYANFKRFSLNGSYVTNGSANDAGYNGAGSVTSMGVAIGSVGGTTRAYITAGGTVNDIQACTVNTGTGAIGGCAASNGGASFASPYGIAMDGNGTHVYATDGNGAYVCNTNSGTGALSACTLSNGGATFAGATGLSIF